MPACYRLTSVCC